MYIASIHIRNYRCFGDTEIEFQPGLNVIIGENNAGKTALLTALGFIFGRNTRSRPDVHDFFQGIKDFSVPPDIEISVTLRSSDRDTLDDKAVVATWLTRLESPWEAQLTYHFFLPEEHTEEFTKSVGRSPDKERFLRTIEALLPKYVTRIYGGERSNLVQAEMDFLNKFEFHFLAAIRDVQSEMFSGSNPLLRSMLKQVLDWDIADDPDGRAKRKSEFRRVSARLHEQLKNRLSLDQLFNLIEDTGAKGKRPIDC